MYRPTASALAATAPTQARSSADASPARAPRRVGLAFIGCGQVTATHSRTLRRFPDVERFYASREAGRARSFADYHRGGGWFGSYEDAFADPRVDAVLIATPPDSHLPLALEGLRAGKHVLVEKPAFLRSDDFDVFELAARAANRVGFVLENYFYKPLAASLRALIASGDLGDVRFVHVDATKRQRARGWRADPARAGGGALFEGGIHWVSLMAHLGLTPLRVEGYRAGDVGLEPFDRPGRDGGTPERSTTVVFRYANGAVGTLLHSWEVPAPLRGLRISHIRGTRGSAAFESNGLFVAVGGRRPRILSPGLRDLLGYRAMFADALGSIRARRRPRYTLAMARRDLRLLEDACGSRVIRDAGAERLAWTY